MNSKDPMPLDEIIRLMQTDGFSRFGQQPVLPADMFRLRGHLWLTSIYPDGTRFERDCGHNRIVDNGLLANVHAWSGDGTATTYQITNLAVGYSAGATESNTTTDLAAELYSAVPIVSYGASGVMNLEISVGKGQIWPGAGNTVTINEAGLQALAVSPTLCTYKVFQPQVVDDSFTLLIRWVITASR